MNIEKADYGTVIQIGTMQDFYTKLQMEGKTLQDVVDYTDKNGVSLLEKSLSTSKFDMAKLLLDNGAKVNVVSKEGCNEFHYIAANIRYKGGLEIAKILLDRGVSLVVKDKKYGNSACYTLCHEILKIASDEMLAFLETCLEQFQEYDACNKAGYSVRKMINQRGTDQLKRMIEVRT